MLDITSILDQASPAAPDTTGLPIGQSRTGRSLFGYRFGRGPLAISLIAGCHADEPIGPAMLDRLAAHLESLDANHPVLADFRFSLVPHVNPDGEAANAAWVDDLGDPATWVDPAVQVAVDLGQYSRHVVRERPGDDIEFGFPRSADDLEARPENRAVAAFLANDAPFAVHGSFHGMAFAAGPWFLIDEAWIDRTESMRDRLRRRVASAGYVVHDIDRQGDKGFRRIDAGFTTRPDSRPMRQHFIDQGDHVTADLFRPSSMEYVRSLGGDPLTLVSEMPLFLLSPEVWQTGDLVRPPAVQRLVQAAVEDIELARVATEVGLEPMPIRDQMRFQLEFLDAALQTIGGVEQMERHTSR